MKLRLNCRPGKTSTIITSVVRNYFVIQNFFRKAFMIDRYLNIRFEAWSCVFDLTRAKSEQHDFGSNRLVHQYLNLRDLEACSKVRDNERDP